jgi:hypothetical protein
MDPQLTADADTNTVPIRKVPTPAPAPEPAYSPPVPEHATPVVVAESSRRTNFALDRDSSPAARQAPAPAAAPCPHCGGTLVSPGSLGWCQKCGYCESLEFEAGPLTAAARKPSPLGTFEILDMIRETPRWVWVLLGGVVGVALISLAADFLLEEDCLERAIYTTAQIGVGLLMVLAAQIWAGVWVGVATEEEIGPKDFILPFRLWSIAIGCLPRSRKPIILAGWGVAVMICAVLLIGGLDFWWEVYNPKKFAPPPSGNMASAAVEDGQQDKAWDQKLKDVAKLSEKTKEDEKKKSKIDRRPTVDCVIIGYLLDNDQLTGLVLARARAGRLAYAGVVRTGFEKVSRPLLKQLAALRQEAPYISGLEINAIWVTPEVVCQIHQSGTDASGLLASPNFKEVSKKK